MSVSLWSVILSHSFPPSDFYQVKITKHAENQNPFGVGVASEPMALRRGGRKLPMEDVCCYQWPLPGVEEVFILIQILCERCLCMSHFVFLFECPSKDYSSTLCWVLTCTRPICGEPRVIGSDRMSAIKTC